MSRRHEVVGLVGPLLVYAVLVSWSSCRMRDPIYPDTIGYVRNAQSIAQGQFGDSVSGYWSPLFSWCIAPFAYFGADELYGARVVLAIWGAGVVLASFWLTRSLVPRFGWLGVLALCLIAVDTAWFATYVITPDLVLSAILLAYCSTVTSRAFPRRRSVQILAGLLGGAAYLAKSYALPFFVVHFTFTVGQHLTARLGAHPWRRVALIWATGISAFLIVSGPWIGVLSWKYGHPTISTVARVAHSVVGPPDKPRDHPLWDRRLYRVPPGRITLWETPEVYPYNHWSPFESMDYFTYQVKYAIKTAASIIGAVSAYDLLRISLPALVLVPMIMSRREWRSRRRKAVWVLGTVAIYALGFVFVFWEDRYTHSFLFPVCCIYCVAFCTNWFRQVAARLGLARRSQYLASAMVALSFAAGAAYWAVQAEQRAKARPAYRQMAEEMRTAGCRGAVASLSSREAYWALYLAYYLGEPFAGCPEEGDVAQIESALNDFRVRTLLVAPGADSSRRFAGQTSWRRRLVLRAEDGAEVYVYVPSDGSGQ